MEIRQQSFNFPELSGSGPQSAETRITFPRSILRATAGMAGYSATFNNSDHHLGRLIVELSSEIDPLDDTTLIVRGSFGLRDWSNEWDDEYSGNIPFVVLADLAAVTPPLPGAPRGDLIIVDAEITQAIQHFRSSQHLDSANVFPDNAIRLVADKPTVVRLYVDYDRLSGLPEITSLSGTLDVTAATGTVTRILPIEAITPRRDVQIERGQRGHTLNFVIPDAQSHGVVSIVARVASSIDATQFSAEFARSLTFENFPALPVIAVGVNYTGPDVRPGATPAQLAAPTMADFINTVMLTERLFPIPQVTFSSFLTMDYDEETESDISEGCDKLDDLLDAVRDMRGDSEDIVLGLIGPGVNTGSVGGCGGDAAAVGFVNAGGTTAHELGHALGLNHAPCDNVTRCAEPANTDGSYPDYAGYDSDSIGEFGFDAFNLNVKDPGNAHDIMGYSGNKWISPYHYKKLMSRLPPVAGPSAGPAAEREDRGDWIKIKQPKLFLNLHIARDHHVHAKAAFVFPAYPQPHGPRRTEYTAELQDEHGHMLRHACLWASSHGPACACGGGESSWPLHIRQAIAFHPRAVKLVIVACDGKPVYTQDVGKAPEVRVDVHGADDRQQTNLQVSWRSEGTQETWYLVQWRDALGTWRGAGPRTRKTELTVPKSLFGRQRKVAIRVLASAGLATGSAQWEGSLALPDAPPGAAMKLGLAGVPPDASGAVPLGRSLQLWVEHGPARPEVRWYDARGAQIGSGRTFELSTLPYGWHAVHAVVLDTGHGRAGREWSIEHRRGGEFFVHLPKRPDNQATQE